MRSRRCSCALVTGTTLLMAISAVFAGTETHGAEDAVGDQVQDMEPTLIADPEPRQLDFPGGSCRSYVETITTMFPQASVILAPGVADFRIPAIKVSLSSITPALKLACGIEGELVYPDQSRRKVRGTLVLEPIARNIIRVNGRPDQSNVSTRVNQRSLRSDPGRHLLVHPLGPIIKNRLTIEEVNRSLDIAFGMIEQDNPAIFYQESTAIFFLYGTEEQNDTFTETISALESVAVHRSSSLRSRENRNEEAPVNDARLLERRKQVEQLRERARNGRNSND